MAAATLLCSPKPFASHRPIQTRLSSLSRPIPTTASANHLPPLSNTGRRQPLKPPLVVDFHQNHRAMAALVGAGLTLTLTLTFCGAASAADIPLWGSSLQLNEPQNALSLPTWAIHVSSVVEWITAMGLVWQYGEKSGYESWKGLSWGMVPLLGGAFCACTWHFFYNSESLEVLVALQAALTVIGNFTMCIAAFRIYKSSQERSENL
ncbi:hypothetical protein HHK36_027896 [Tetracentron sinense]|uniref:Ycf49-like protein n=1 Tax=Tetracentron sinense TaxID=13715 RepID=A0A835D1Z0_TETSI|nr:hypothetical protein HHK36_027896 [Tetracentron sinense]